MSSILTACSIACQLNKLQRVQNASARLIFLESKYCHVRPLLYNLHWLPVRFRIDFKILLLTYKAINGLAPFYLQELLSLKEACKYKLGSDCDGLLLNPVKFKTLTTLGDRSFAAAAPQLWNSLPYSIRSSRLRKGLFDRHASTACDLFAFLAVILPKFSGILSP